MSALFLQAGNPENASQFAALYAQCFDDAWSTDAFAGFFASPGVVAWLAGLGAQAESFLVLRIAADECEILTIGTLPAARRHGLAQFLLRHGAFEAQAMGAVSMFLEVAETNAAARALYSALGFRANGRRVGYYRSQDGQSVDALAWRAALPLTSPISGAA